ncbi:MAG: NAD(P)-dependent oxidoreductase [Pseudomonadota bacterium]
MEKIKKIGFVGVGTMGNAMAKNLINKGFSVVAYDIVEERIHAVEEAGGIPASSPREAAKEAQAVITMLPSSPDVEQAVLGKDGIIEGMAEGAIYIDMSTIDPMTTRKIAKMLSEKKIEMLDSPVTKGVDAAIQGTLTLLIGGKKDVFEKVRPVLEAMGSNLYHMGEVGTGSATKLVNNLCVGIITAATAEAFVFGAKAGVDPDKLFEAISGGSGSSFVLNKHIKNYSLKRKFDEVIFPVDYIMKDIGLAMKTAKELNMPLMIASFVYEIYAMLKAKGRGKGYHPEVITIFEDYAGIEVKGKE